MNPVDAAAVIACVFFVLIAGTVLAVAVTLPRERKAPSPFKVVDSFPAPAAPPDPEGAALVRSTYTVIPEDRLIVVVLPVGWSIAICADNQVGADLVHLKAELSKGSDRHEAAGAYGYAEVRAVRYSPPQGAS